MFIATLTARAQTAAAPRKEWPGPMCYVYVLDMLKAGKAAAQYLASNGDEKNQRALDAAQVIFPEFHPTQGEEELTTKTYRFPHSRLYITAGVFYTDESMPSVAGADSVMLSVTVGPRALSDAFDADRGAMAELTAATADTARVKQYVRVRGRLYLVGMECNFKEPPGDGSAP
jgi:hypothetical protein